MSWQTVMVCDDCYEQRKAIDPDLVETPVRMREYIERCFFCGFDADIPVRLDVPNEPTRCPGCGAQPIDVGSHLETLHAGGCTWMADMDAEPYDDRLTLVDLTQPPEDVV